MNLRVSGIAVCLLLVIVGTVQAVSLMEIDSGSADGSVLDLKISGLASATSIQFDLIYDPDIVEIASIRRAEGFQGVSMTTNTNIPGTARVLVIFPDPVTIDSPTGVVGISFSSLDPGSSPLTLSNARWSDFPDFTSIEFDNLNGGVIESTTAPGATPSPTPPPSSGGSSGTRSPAPVSTYDPGDFFRSDDPVELPALPESTPAPAAPPAIDPTPEPLPAEATQAVPEPTPAPLSIIPLSGLIAIPFIRRIIDNK